VLVPFGTGGSVGAPADGRLWEMGWDAVLQGAMQILGICIGICIALGCMQEHPRGDAAVLPVPAARLSARLSAPLPAHP
jgi:hypothetical protein